MAQGQAERATRLLGAAAALFEVFDPVMDPTDRAAYERSIGAVQTKLDTATFDAAWVAGRAMTLEQAIDFALDGT